MNESQKPWGREVTQEEWDRIWAEGAYPIGYWNHRVVRRVYDKGTLREEIGYAVHEAFYGVEEGDKPLITTESNHPYGETLEELREDLLRMLKCLDNPVLDYDTREESAF